LHINSRARVVLQTAQAIASTSGVTKIQGCKIRVIFDAGSQRPYMREKLAEMLQLKSMGSTIMEHAGPAEHMKRHSRKNFLLFYPIELKFSTMIELFIPNNRMIFLFGI